MTDLADDAQTQVDTLPQAARARIEAELALQGCADCVDCGEKIVPLRRSALPSATRCFACQGVFEMRRSRRG